MNVESMTDPALHQLIGMLSRAGFRSVWRKIKTPSGAIMALGTIGLLSFGFFPLIATFISDGGYANAPFVSIMTEVMPLAIAAFALVVVGLDAGRNYMELRPAELQFVLAGPFSDRQILSYRLITIAMGIIPMSLFFSLYMIPIAGSVIGACVGLVLTITFVLLLGVFRALLTPRLSPWSSSLVRAVASVGLMLVVAEIMWRIVGSQEPFSAEAIESSINESWLGWLLMIPTQPMVQIIFEPLGTMTLLNVFLSLMLVLVVLVGCYRLNDGFSELAVEGVARRIQRLERLKSGNVSGILAKNKNAKAKRSLPMFSWIAGVGPIAWLQVTSSFRRAGKIIPGLVLLGVVGAIASLWFEHYRADSLTEGSRSTILPIAMGAVSYLGVIIMTVSQSGFGAPKRMLDWFYLLPIRPLPMAIGMVVGPASVLWAKRIAIFVAVVVLASQSWLACFAILLAGLAFDLAFVSATSFVSAAARLRPIADGPPDVLQGARAILFMLAVMCALIPSLLAGGIGVLFCFAIADISWGSGALGLALGTFALQPLVWWGSGIAFSQREPA